ncbi:hypothetical protein ACFE04_030229 [Oxalis oulophora]
MQATNGTSMYSNRLLFTSLGLLLVSSFLLLPTSDANNYDDNTEFIRTICNTSLSWDPELCFSSLSMYATTINKNPSSLVKQSIYVAISNVNDSAHYFESQKNEYNLSDDPVSQGAARALQTCIGTFNLAIDSMNTSLIKMHEIETTPSSSASNSSEVSHDMKLNARMWKLDAQMEMLGAAVYEATCSKVFKDVSVEPVKKEVVIDRVNQVWKLTKVAHRLVIYLYNDKN